MFDLTAIHAWIVPTTIAETDTTAASKSELKINSRVLGAKTSPANFVKPAEPTRTNRYSSGIREIKTAETATSTIANGGFDFMVLLRAVRPFESALEFRLASPDLTGQTPVLQFQQLA